jgi:hypothetical protein
MELLVDRGGTLVSLKYSTMLNSYDDCAGLRKDFENSIHSMLFDLSRGRNDSEKPGHSMLTDLSGCPYERENSIHCILDLANSENFTHSILDGSGPWNDSEESIYSIILYSNELRFCWDCSLEKCCQSMEVEPPPNEVENSNHSNDVDWDKPATTLDNPLEAAKLPPIHGGWRVGVAG